MPDGVAAAWWMSVLVLVFAVAAPAAWTRRRRERPLARQMRARPVTYRSTVDVRAVVFGAMLSRRGPLYLDVYGDSFRVYHPFAPARLVFGQDYSCRGRDMVIEVVPGLLHEWIEISGPPGSAARIQIAHAN